MRAVLIVVCSLLICLTVQQCHYSCLTCASSEYYDCILCQPNRGNNGVPIYGMCYCDNSSDQDQSGVCQPSGSYNNMSKALIIVFISLTLFLGVFAIWAKGMKYFLFKTIEDVQELSLIVFINMYFPQQFDIFLSHLYSFNISSYTFQNLAAGSLFVLMPDASMATVDGQNIFGKYRLLQKTANFFSNQFTWIIVFVSIFAAALVLRFVRGWLRKRRDFAVIKRTVEGQPVDESHAQLQQEGAEWVQVVRRDRNADKVTVYSIVSKLYNMTWFNVLIVFFYFSLIEMNINIFTQVANLTFSSSFATTGSFFSALFLAAQIILLCLLFLKAREQMIKPQWMRDYSYTATVYLMRTNYKSLTKYFWFISCIKKALLALMLTVQYQSPQNAIVGVCCVHAVYISIAVYCEPFERKYIRAHFYCTEAMKLFLFMGLIDFTSEYGNGVQLISLTVIFYGLLAAVFGLHFLFMMISLFVEKEVYKHFIRRKFCREEYTELEKEKVGYRSCQKVFIYVKE